MDKLDNSWQSLIIPATLMMTVSLSSVPGIPAMSPPPIDIWDNHENNQIQYDNDWVGKNTSLRTLTQIQNLEYDWDGYGGDTIPANVILLAKSIVMTLEHQPEIYPTKRRTVQMQYELADRSYLEFEVFADKIEMLLVPKRRYADAIERTISADQYYGIKHIVKDFFLS